MSIFRVFAELLLASLAHAEPATHAVAPAPEPDKPTRALLDASRVPRPNPAFRFHEACRPDAPPAGDDAEANAANRSGFAVTMRQGFSSLLSSWLEDELEELRARGGNFLASDVTRRLNDPQRFLQSFFRRRLQRETRVRADLAAATAALEAFPRRRDLGAFDANIKERSLLPRLSDELPDSPTRRAIREVLELRRAITEKRQALKTLENEQEAADRLPREAAVRASAALESRRTELEAGLRNLEERLDTATEPLGRLNDPELLSSFDPASPLPPQIDGRPLPTEVRAWMRAHRNEIQQRSEARVHFEELSKLSERVEKLEDELVALTRNENLRPAYALAAMLDAPASHPYLFAFRVVPAPGGAAGPPPRLVTMGSSVWQGGPKKSPARSVVVYETPFELSPEARSREMREESRLARTAAKAQFDAVPREPAQIDNELWCQGTPFVAIDREVRELGRRRN